MKKIIFSYEDTITYSVKGVYLEQSLKAINKKLVGTSSVNKVNVNGACCEDGKVSQHKNFKALQEAHYAINAGRQHRVRVTVYDDGSHELEILK